MSVSAPSALTIRYSVGGTASPGEDFVPLSGAVTIPAGARRADLPLVAIDDGAFEAAESVTLALLPDSNYALGNPSAATLYVESDDAAPDLVPTVLTAPSAIAAGSSVAVSDTTCNQGAGSASASVTRFYLSLDALLDESDPELQGSRAVPALSAGACSTGATNVVVPAATASGQYMIVAKADAAGALRESIEANNVRAALARVGGDLAIAEVVAPTSAGEGTSISVTAAVENLGPGGVEASQVAFYLSTDGSLDAADARLGEAGVASLPPGSTVSRTIVGTIPAGTPAGEYRIIAKADAAAAVYEIVEANNLLAAYLRVGGNLVIEDLWAPATVRAGATIVVRDTTGNSGVGSVDASRTGFYLSTDLVLDDGDVRLQGYRPVGTLASGQSSTGESGVTLPLAVPTGDYYLIAKADVADAVPELVEADNLRAAETTVSDVTVVRIRVIREGGRRVDWGPSGRLAFDAEGADGWFDVYTMLPDGSDVECLTCDVPDFSGVHAGNPAWHPSGNYLVFQALKPFVDTTSCPYAFTPGAGVANDLWVMDYRSRQVWRLTEVDLFDGGVLHPHFSRSGDRLLWSDRIQAGGSFGVWALRVAPFQITDGQPALGEAVTWQPGAQPRFYESHGFSPDGREIIFSSNLGQAEDKLDVYRLNLATGALRDLTGAQADWDEHGQWSPDGKKIVWMSSFKAGDTPGEPRTDYWIMSPDGGSRARLTFFNDEHYPEFQPDATLAGDVAWSPDGTKLAAYVMYGQQPVVEPCTGLTLPPRYPNARIAVVELAR
jgi:Tol biopolymer transport system component